MIGSEKIKKTGFTLTEIIVVTAIFALVASMAIGLMIAVTRTQRKGIALQNIQDNGRHLMAFMAKEIRVSEIKTSNPPNETDVLVITPPDSSEDITYTFTGTPNWQIARKAYIYLEKGNKWDWITVPLNSDDVKVSGTFVIDGKTLDDNEQPRVTIIMKIEALKITEPTGISLQTTISQRNLD